MIKFSNFWASFQAGFLNFLSHFSSLRALSPPCSVSQGDNFTLLSLPYSVFGSDNPGFVALSWSFPKRHCRSVFHRQGATTCFDFVLAWPLKPWLCPVNLLLFLPLPVCLIWPLNQASSSSATFYCWVFEKGIQLWKKIFEWFSLQPISSFRLIYCKIY